MDSQYETLMAQILGAGTRKKDRTGTGVFSMFGAQLRYDLRRAFPLITTRRIKFQCVVDELLWFISGSTNVNDLPKRTQPWWKPWARPSGELGPIYGKQWRDINLPNGVHIDQLADVVESIKTDPDSRRLVVSAWNASEIDNMALPPCHAMFQFYVADGELSCQLYQRSADMFLGVPANIASYSLLTHIVARECGLRVGDFIWSGGDCHIYANHIDQVEEQLARQPRDFPTLCILDRGQDMFEHVAEDFILFGYDPHPHISAPLAV